MKNRILALAHEFVPYMGWLRPLAGSVTACIVMQALDYWFSRYPNGFYKFLEPPTNGHPQYKLGDSWTEKLYMSAEEFRTAFDKIGLRYKSKREYNIAQDKFGGKLYCSYHDKIKGLTYYFRNHAAVDQALDALVQQPHAVPPAEPGNPDLRNSATPIYVTGQSQFTENGDANIRNSATPIPNHTEITTKITTKTTTATSPEVDHVPKASVVFTSAKNKEAILQSPLEATVAPQECVPPPPEIVKTAAKLGIRIGQNASAVEALLEMGVKPIEKARQIVEKRGEVVVADWIAAVRGKYINTSKRGAAAVLVSALSGDEAWDLPSAYLAVCANEIRHTQQREMEEYRAKAIQHAAASARDEAEEKERMWEALPAARRQEIEAQARAEIADRPTGAKWLNTLMGRENVRLRCLQLMVQADTPTAVATTHRATC